MNKCVKKQLQNCHQSDDIVRDEQTKSKTVWLLFAITVLCICIRVLYMEPLYSLIDIQYNRNRQYDFRKVVLNFAVFQMYVFFKLFVSADLFVLHFFFPSQSVCRFKYTIT